MILRAMHRAGGAVSGVAAAVLATVALPFMLAIPLGALFFIRDEKEFEVETRRWWRDCLRVWRSLVGLS